MAATIQMFSQIKWADSKGKKYLEESIVSANKNGSIGFHNTGDSGIFFPEPSLPTALFFGATRPTGWLRQTL
jgi:hypothetical protein